VVLVSGSGPQDRNEELMDHKPFLVLSDYLTRQGIGVLRYDDRGVGKSTGDFGAATSADFATDALAAVNYLKTRPEVNSKFIGIAGHSEGGFIAPMVAAQSKDVGFIVMLAGPGVIGKELLALQKELITKAAGASPEAAKKEASELMELYDVVCSEKDEAKAKAKFSELLKKQYDALPEQGKKETGDFAALNTRYILSIFNPWMKYFLCSDPSVYLKKVKCPVLALNGDKDLQVDADQNLPGIQKALKKAKNKKVIVHKLKNLNHLFQTSEIGSPSDYAKIEETMSPVVLKIVADWVLSISKS
jgi:pimeloyl-ACP methyl ester carboxylesterase